jgi:hypothetical protein
MKIKLTSALLVCLVWVCGTAFSGSPATLDMVTGGDGNLFSADSELSALVTQNSSPVRTPFQLETGVNTAACNTSNPQSYCSQGFPVGSGPWKGGWCDNRSVVTRVIQPGVGDYGSGYFGNISKGRGNPPWPDTANPGDVHNLLYPGNTTRIFAVIQHWFSTADPVEVILCDPLPAPGRPCAGISQSVAASAYIPGAAVHKMTGYNCNDTAYTDAMADDLWDRGFDGVIANVGPGPYTCAQVTLSSGEYKGQPNNFTKACPNDWIDEGLHKLQSSMLTRHGAGFQFALEIDQSFSKICLCKDGNCRAESDRYQPQCIRDQMKAVLNYYLNGDVRGLPPFFTAGNYLTPQPNSPVVQFFNYEGGYCKQCSPSNQCIVDAQQGIMCDGSKDCWEKIWSGMREYVQNELGLNPYFVFLTIGQTGVYNESTQSFDHVQSDGCYLWPWTQHFPGTVADQLNWGKKQNIDFHYSNWSTYNGVKGANGQTALFFGAAWKGVDDRFWDPGDVPEHHKGGVYQGLVMSQRSGRTWVDTFAEAGNYFSTRNQLPYLQVQTYDDYEAGTQFQTGIDNNASVSATLTGTTLSWQTTFKGSLGSPDTLHHYRLFDSPDGVSVTVLRDDIPPDLKGSLNIGELNLGPGAHTLYLKLVGKAGIFNKISNAVPVAGLQP